MGVCDLCGQDLDHGNAIVLPDDEADNLAFSFTVARIVTIESPEGEQAMLHPIQVCTRCFAREMGKRIDFLLRNL